MATPQARRYRLHLESRREQASAFHLSPSAWRHAAARHPALAAQIDASFGWDGETLEQALADADCLLATRFAKPLVNAAPRLRWIHTTSAGVDSLMPLDELRADLLLSNSSGVHSERAQEYAQMALLMLHARMPAQYDAQRAHRWEPRLIPLIRGKTVLVVGFGDIGSAVGRAARALGLYVIAATRSGRVVEGSPADRTVPVEQLDQVLADADFVVITAPLTAATRNLFDARRLGLMRPAAGLINMSRAGLLDYPALYQRLENGSCGGAILDVFDPEPLPADAPAWDVPGLIVTPHVSCDLPDYAQRVLDLWFGNFGRLVRGEPLDNLVDRTLGY
jgi:phosphoglycerate dehydrogenase-like enzyme